ncbi:putative MHC class II antigen protein, partial [Naja naja]
MPPPESETVPPPSSGGASHQSLKGRSPHPPFFLVGASSSMSGWERWTLESLLTAFLLLLLLLLPLAAHFLFQHKAECRFLNGVQQVRFLEHHIYDRQEYLHFDSDLGKFVAVMEFGKGVADYWNRDKQWLRDWKAAVDYFCLKAYEALTFKAAKREEGRLPPVSHPTPSRVDPSSTNGWERWALDSKLTAILLAAHFLMQAKTECRFLNGTQRVRFLFRYIYDRQEFVCFNSDLGKNVAITALGEGDADKWNRDEQILHYQKAQVDRLCRRNYLLGSYEAAKREERLIGR